MELVSIVAILVMGLLLIYRDWVRTSEITEIIKAFKETKEDVKPQLPIETEESEEENRLLELSEAPNPFLKEEKVHPDIEE